MRLDGKVAIITGAASGIGYATAEKFLCDGAAVMICDIDALALEKAEAKLSELGRVSSMVCDISKTQLAAETVKKTVKKFKTVDILINNAGITDDAQLYKMSEDQFWKVIEVNLKGTMIMSKAVIPIMMERNYGRIINSSSVSAFAGNFGQTNYAASKGAIASLSRSMGKELGKYNITVNAIAPGAITTPMTLKIPDEIREKKALQFPMKRWGDPKEVANVYAFLASDEASFVNATVIFVDGGLL